MQLFDAIFTLSREEIVKRVHEGTLNKSALYAHDYVYDASAAEIQSLDQTD